MPSDTASQFPTYPTHDLPKINVKLQQRFTGSFRPVAGKRHLHRYYNFTELMTETVSRSLHHSCRSELTRQGISLPQDRYCYGRRLLGLQFNASLCSQHPLLTFQHRAGVRPYTSSYDFAKPCVFVKQSPGSFLCVPLTWEPFLPKLQGYFAQFLSHESLERLRILIPGTCVGLRYRLNIPEAQKFFSEI
eukprot:TRINITY_DN900_c1_g1_i3.p1 TRINITY_DN900_c1_g1~~TRINITY_DN900_c1_g1_i3.p1  ORF type:complete len:190 (-),score=-54.50 TRINITY_DN900_c1_g1_i3:132-701(-)